MQIRLPKNIEQRVINAAQRGDYNRVANEIAEAVRKNGPAVVPVPPKQATPESHEERMDLLEQFLLQQSSTNPDFDDSRKAMYFDQQ